jgi:hypothetical protein
LVASGLQRREATWFKEPAMQKPPRSHRTARARDRSARSPEPDSSTTADERAFDQRDTLKMPPLPGSVAEPDEEGDALAEADPDDLPSTRAPEL